MVTNTEKDEIKHLIDMLDECCMDPEDRQKLVKILEEHPKKGGEKAMDAMSFGSLASDVLQFGSYEIGRDVFEPWHKCKFVDNKKCCNYVNVVSEYDPDNPPQCQGSDEFGKAHPFTPCPKGR